MICRVCKSGDLRQFLDLGTSPPADQFRRPEQLGEPDVYYPLRVLMCAECGLAQLSHVVSPEVLYRNDYPYEASITATGQRHWREFARTVVDQLGVPRGSLVVDIGSNVGVLLDAFKSCGMVVLGVDPAVNIVRLAERRGIETLPEFFSPRVAEAIRAQRGRARIITGTNVFAHIDDLGATMRGVELLLEPEGVLVMEAPYFKNLVRMLEYDTIYHEHLSYLSVRPLVRFFEKCGMEIFSIQERDIHGGSFRVFVNRKGCRAVGPEVAAMLEEEARIGLHSPDGLARFAGAVEQNRKELVWLLRRLKHEGKSIAAVSAPAKGMTLLNYCRIGADTIDFVTEKSQLKIGRFTPGAHIPVLPDAELLARKPDYALLLAWNFAEEIMQNLSAYREAGGAFIIPIPTPRILA